MKRRAQNRGVGTKQGSVRRATGVRRRPTAERVAGWRVRRVPLRRADFQKSSAKATPMAAEATGPKGASSPAGAALSFGRILVPIDFSAESTRALKFATSLGQGDDANLLLVHVVGPLYDLRDAGSGSVQRRRPTQGLLRHARQRLQTVGRRQVGEKWPWRCIVRSGTAPRQIVKVAEELHADLIVMPTRGLSPAPPAELGSTAERVVRHAPCPVLVLPKPAPRKGPNP